MKYSLIIFGCLFAAAQGINQKVVDQIHENIKVVTDKCLVETGASADDLDSITKNQPLSTHESKCLLFCISKGLNMQNEDGTINKDHENENKELIQKQDPETFEKADASFRKCADTVTVNKDPCITASDLSTCWHEENKKKGLQWNFI